MRRTIAVLAVVLGFGLLAACGGGGGGGSTPPVTSPSGNPGPSAHPSSSPTPTVAPTATAKPTAAPSSAPSATASPTPAPTQKPTATPPPTPTPVPTASPTPSSTATPNRTMTVSVGFGQINGTDPNLIISSAPNTHNNSGEGDLEPSDAGAQPGGGGQGSTVDANESFPWGNGIPTAISMSNNYHVHAFLGLYVNGTEMAIPDGIGMVNPFGDFQSTDPSGCTGGANNFECYADAFYYMHTHDASGVIHMEAPSPVCGSWQSPPAGSCPSVFTLGNFFDVWGISISANNFGPFNGPVTIYAANVGTPSQCTSSACYTGSNTYSLYTGDPRALALDAHTVVWILVGSGNPTGSALPNIQWYVAH